MTHHDRLVAEGNGGSGAAVASPARVAGRGRWWRIPVMSLSLLLLAVMAPLSVVATWTHDMVSDTDRYVETVAPLADDVAVQDAVAARITSEVTSRIDVQALVDDGTSALTDLGLPSDLAEKLGELGDPLTGGVRDSIAELVDEVVRSNAFARAWSSANRLAHSQVVVVLTGQEGEPVEVEGDAVSLNLAVLMGSVEARLVDAGFTLAERLPTTDVEFTLFQSPALPKAQTGFWVLSTLSWALPLVALLLLAVALFTAARRRRMLRVGSLVVAASMATLGLVLVVLRRVYLDSVPPDQIPPEAAGAVYDQLLRFISLELRTLLLVSIVVAAIAWVTEPGNVIFRWPATRALAAARRRLNAVGWGTGPVAGSLGRHQGTAQFVILVLAAVIYVSTDHSSGIWRVQLVCGTAVILLALALLAAPSTADDDRRGEKELPGATNGGRTRRRP